MRLVDYVNGMLVDVTWQVFYLFKTEVSDKVKLEADPALLTSLKWLSSDNKNKLSKSVLLLCRKLRLFGPDEPFYQRRENQDGLRHHTNAIHYFRNDPHVPSMEVPCRSFDLHCPDLRYLRVLWASYYVEVFSKSTQWHSKAAEKVITRQRTSRSNSNASMSQSISNGRLDQAGTMIVSGGTSEVNLAPAGQEEEFDTDDVVNAESFDDYDEEFSLNDIWDEDEIDYMLTIDE